MKYIKFIPIISLCAVLTTGCASTGKVNDKNYLRAVSISGKTEKTLTFTFFSDEDSVITVSGSDIDSAKELAELKSGKKFITGYTELLILDDCNCRETLEYMLTNWKVSPSCYVTCAVGDGEKILSETTAEVLCGSVKNAAAQGKSPDCDIISVLTEILGNENSAPVAEITADGFSGVRYISGSE